MPNPVTINAAPLAPPHAANQGIDQQKVDTALRTITADSMRDQSQLANALDNPNLNQAERDYILQELVRGDESGLTAFYGNDINRSERSDPTLGTDHQIIGEALDQAYQDGIINADDLLRIADSNDLNGAQHLLGMLQTGSSGANSAVEAFSDALWQRDGNDGTDRAVAAIGYTSSPELQSRNLNSPEVRREAFEALVAYNDAAPYNDVLEGSLTTQWENNALTAAGTLFVNNTSELVDFYAGGAGADVNIQTEVLARFMGQTVFNPDAASIVLDRQRDLIPAIQSAISSHADGLLADAADATAGSRQQENLIEQFGRLDASISGGAAVALDRYSEAILANEASRQQFASIVGALVGKTPASKVPGSTQVTTAITNAIYDAITTPPERPDQSLANAIHDAHFNQVRTLANELDQTGLTTAFNSAQAVEITQLQGILGVNLGG